MFFKTIDGYIKIKEGKNFGFVGDIFVDESLLKDNVVAGEYVSVKAVITYNQKKDSWLGVRLLYEQLNFLCTYLSLSFDKIGCGSA